MSILTVFKSSASLLKYAQAYSVLSKVLKTFPVLRFFTFTVPLGITLDFFIRGVKRHFITLRAVMPQQYNYVFTAYAAEFVRKFGMLALSNFQRFVGIITVFVNSMLASAVFISLKFIDIIFYYVKLPFTLFIFYYAELYQHFLDLLKLLAPVDYIQYGTLIYNCIALSLLTIFIFVVMRFAITILSLLNQIRLTFVLCVDHIQAEIIKLMHSAKQDEIAPPRVKVVPKVLLPTQEDLNKLSPQELVALAQKSFKIK